MIALTPDLYFAAYLVASGRYMDRALCQWREADNGDRILLFAFDLADGEDLEAIEGEYRMGRQVSAQVHAQAIRDLKKLVHRG